MRKFLMAVLFLPLVSMAQPVVITQKLNCNSTTGVFEKIARSEFKEKPVWIGSNKTSKIVVVVNEKTGTWTIIQFNDEIACLFAAGEGYRLIMGEDL